MCAKVRARALSLLLFLQWTYAPFAQLINFSARSSFFCFWVCVCDIVVTGFKFSGTRHQLDDVHTHSTQDTHTHPIHNERTHASQSEWTKKKISLLLFFVWFMTGAHKKELRHPNHIGWLTILILLSTSGLAFACLPVCLPACLPGVCARYVLQHAGDGTATNRRHRRTQCRSNTRRRQCLIFFFSNRKPNKHSR